MQLLKSSFVQADELTEVFRCLPAAATGLSADAVLPLWKRWHQQGLLLLGRVDAIAEDGSRQLQALGATVWITDAAVASLHQSSAQGCVHRFYEAASRGALQQPAWIMGSRELEQAHEKNQLNLMVLHFWSAVEVGSQAFHQVFLHTHGLFRDQHQGFGVQRLLQEVFPPQVPLLQAAGMQVVFPAAPATASPLALMEITTERAVACPGSTFSFLFFSPARCLALKPAAQRMLLLALRQLTDEEIANVMGCTRDYIRKLWTDTYVCLQNAGALACIDMVPHTSTRGASAVPKRGRERRRLALEFVRANPHELRPALTGKVTD